MESPLEKKRAAIEAEYSLKLESVVYGFLVDDGVTASMAAKILGVPKKALVDFALDCAGVEAHEIVHSTIKRCYLYKGRAVTCGELAKIIGVQENAVYTRIKRYGIQPGGEITEPFIRKERAGMHAKKFYVEGDTSGELFTTKELSLKYAISKHTLEGRIKKMGYKTLDVLPQWILASNMPQARKAHLAQKALVNEPMGFINPPIYEIDIEGFIKILQE